MDGSSSTQWPEVDDKGWSEDRDQTFKTLGIIGQSLRKWSPLQSLQGNLGLGSTLEDFSPLQFRPNG